MAKVVPGGEDAIPRGKYGSLGNESMTFTKPIPCTPPLAAYDETYVRRKREVAEREQMLTCKSGRKLCYFTDGAPDPSAEGVSVVLCLHACGQGRFQYLQKEPFVNIFQICVDRMGHGKSSSTPRTGYPFDLLVAELIELVDAVYAERKIPPEKKFFITGHSMGATCTIEMAACPAIRDRIAAIAPMSGPGDVRNPSVTKEELKAIRKDIPPLPLMMACQKNSCYGALGRWFINKFFRLRQPDKDYGCAKYYVGDSSLMTGIKGQGTKAAHDAIDKDPFYVTMGVDIPIPGGVNTWDTPNEYKRCFGAPWFYDPREVTVPCFIYNGEPEENSRAFVELTHRLIAGSELVIMDGHGHISIMMESRRIIEALVKMEKVGAPSWASST